MPPRISPVRLPGLFKHHALRIPRRGLVAAPKPGSGPLMSRRPDRALPDVSSTRRLLFRTIPLFALIVAGSALAIFNYQKSTSSVVNSTLYALRTNEEVRKALGDQIYFASKYPWIWGTIDQLHGNIDISYSVKGTRQKGVVKFKSVRRSRMGFFETTEWSLTTEDGQTLQLLKTDRPDPFKNVDTEKDTMAQELA